MRGSRRRMLGIGALVLAIVAFWAPSFVAARYTNDAVPTHIVGHPLRGWHFLGDAVRTSRAAAAGTEGNARGIAARHWWASRVRVGRLELVYVDRRPFTVPIASGGIRRSAELRRIDANARFLWFVYGTVGSRPEQVVGLINMRTGRIVWDIRKRRIGAR